MRPRLETRARIKPLRERLWSWGLTLIAADGVFDLDTPRAHFGEELLGGNIALLKDCSQFFNLSSYEHLQDDAGGPCGCAHHGRELRLGVKSIDHGECVHGRTFVGFQSHDGDVGLIALQFFNHQVSHQSSWRDFDFADLARFLVEQAEFIERANLGYVSLVANGFFETLADLSA